jgi:hypothetical protein
MKPKVPHYCINSTVFEWIVLDLFIVVKLETIKSLETISFKGQSHDIEMV